MRSYQASAPENKPRTGANTGAAADSQPPDKDGLINLLERAFKLNPSPTRASLPHRRHRHERSALDPPDRATASSNIKAQLTFAQSVGGESDRLYARGFRRP